MSTLTAEQLKDLLHLTPHFEGGFFIETDRSATQVKTDRYHANDGVRSAGTAIYFMLTAESPVARFCRNLSPILHVWCGGGAQTHTFIMSDGTLSEQVLGPRLELGQRLQVSKSTLNSRSNVGSAAFMQHAHF